ncbi:MAG: D-glycero-beta-D-manno-heptose 1,7-bisphosphate 7-phosphatase [Rubrivivax sp.]
MADTGHKAVFLDRDGVINEEREYVHRIDDFVLLPGVAAGLRRLKAAGYRLIVITNQAGIAHGYYTEAQYATLTTHMRALLAAEGVTLDAVYHCPHHPKPANGQPGIDCECRKPAPGMILRAADQLQIDLARSALFGDKGSDLEAARAAGVQHRVLLLTGHATEQSDRDMADCCAIDMDHAVSWLLIQAGNTAPARPAAV